LFSFAEKAVRTDCIISLRFEQIIFVTLFSERRASEERAKSERKASIAKPLREIVLVQGLTAYYFYKEYDIKQKLK